MKLLYNSLITIILGVAIGIIICELLAYLNTILAEPIPEFLIGAWSMTGFAIMNKFDFTR